jgi:adenylosuccinate lyase
MKEYVHFCCTSEDINNISYSLMMTDAKNNLLIKSLEGVIAKLV